MSNTLSRLIRLIERGAVLGKVDSTCCAVRYEDRYFKLRFEDLLTDPPYVQRDLERAEAHLFPKADPERLPR